MLQKVTIGAIVLLTLVSFAAAQVAPTAAASVAIAGAPMRGPAIALRTELMDTAPIKGSPFCATVVNEHTQTFADGNKIHTVENSALCRDSEGRTRRESQVNLLGAVPEAKAPTFITIVDPVAGVRYVLDSSAKIARKGQISSIPPGVAMGVPPKAGQNVMFYTRDVNTRGSGESPAQTVVVQRQVARGQEPPADSENLGDQMFGSIHATGTRITTTIPAGKMGNEKPINVVSEDWYSPELKTMVKTIHSDPWAGELTTQLTNVNTSEPDPSLFTVPNDYKVVDAGSEPFVWKMPPSEPEK